MKLLISQCLLGVACRYDGKSVVVKEVADLVEKIGKDNCIPICPEVEGGLSTPRLPCERRGGKVLNKEGEDCTAFFEKGAVLALEKARAHDCRIALLKSKSPSCGSGIIYDGSFSSALTTGNGVTATLLQKNGITVFDETQTHELMLLCKNQ